ncbi:protein of unknown function [Taphrina deformans PYCC 5710]|uniref:Uncharacterized protein n=1 Tax=Taphrina deformans (strain PYCC 5710 / ATCC 11124 / CBS 356.35 / IMI 108563 / JCM 9778 / NBRC 8474) TaxID=1097556 RepID=R4XJG7_TAPDE|nr:protein of unknown function [Taphrina deformans PYCC 5710]|eukprot:CCG83495.1 protein of unknown function [Taphrina deformans PYCC 5710]
METILLLIIIAVISFFFLQYFKAEDPTPNTESELVWVTRNIDNVLVLFPNEDHSALAYELSRSRSVESCIEKLLAGEKLPTPPEDSRYHGWDLKLEGSDLASARTVRTAPGSAVN